MDDEHDAPIAPVLDFPLVASLSRVDRGGRLCGYVYGIRDRTHASVMRWKAVDASLGDLGWKATKKAAVDLVR